MNDWYLPLVINEIILIESFLQTPSKGQQGSNNAYMLVYTSAASLNEIRRRSESIKTETDSSSNNEPPERKKAKILDQKTNNKVINDDGPLPMYLKAFIEQDRRLLDEELKEQILLKETKHKEQASLQTKMKNHYEQLPIGNNLRIIKLNNKPIR